VPENEIDSAFQSVYEYSSFVGRAEDPRMHHLHAIIYQILANGALFDPTSPSSVSELRAVLLPSTTLTCGPGATESRRR
jgi:hypothetical protein